MPRAAQTMWQQTSQRQWGLLWMPPRPGSLCGHYDLLSRRGRWLHCCTTHLWGSWTRRPIGCKPSWWDGTKHSQWCCRHKCTWQIFCVTRLWWECGTFSMRLAQRVHRATKHSANLPRCFKRTRIATRLPLRGRGASEPARLIVKEAPVLPALVSEKAQNRQQTLQL